jgi:hypothetical protein
MQLQIDTPDTKLMTRHSGLEQRGPKSGDSICVFDSSRHDALYGLAQINAYGNGDAPDEGLRRLETLFQEGHNVAISTNTFLPLLRAYARRGMF